MPSQPSATSTSPMMAERFQTQRTHQATLARPTGRLPALTSLLLFPERQQALRGGTADHAGDADCDLPQRCRRNAAERDRANADLTPEVEIAPRVRTLGLELFDRGERILADGAELPGIGGLDHLGERRLDRRRLVRQLAAQEFAQTCITHGIACERIARHAADRQLVVGVAAF